MKNLFFISSVLILVFYGCDMGGNKSKTYTSNLVSDSSFGQTCSNNSDCASSICNNTFNKCGCESDSDCINSGVCTSNGLCINIEPMLATCTKGYSTYKFKIIASIDSSTQDITSSCTFTSDTPSLATPNQDASFSCLAVGQTNIKATLPSNYDSKVINAAVKINDVFTVSPEPATCVVGKTVDLVAKYGSTVVTGSTTWTVIGGSGQITASTTKGRFNCNSVGLGQYQAKYSTYTAQYGNIYVTREDGCPDPRLYPNKKAGKTTGEPVCFDPYCGEYSQIETIHAWGPVGNPIAQPVWRGRGGCYLCKSPGSMTVNVKYAGTEESTGTLTCE